MTLDQLTAILAKFQAVRIGSEVLARCPLHQEENTEPRDYKLLLSPGRVVPLVLWCRSCGIPGEEHKTHNSEVAQSAAAGVGVSFSELSEHMEEDEILELWEQLGPLGSGSRERIEPAPEATLNKVYSYLLDQLLLSAAHQKWLSKRGLFNGEELGYRTAPKGEELYTLAGLCEQKFGPELLKGVPGFTLEGSCKEVRLWLRAPAILTPCRSLSGGVVALKQRLVGENKNKLRLVTSSHRGGPHSLSPCHVPLGVGEQKWTELWITEGERKADVYWTSKKVPTLSIPGIGQWRQAIPVTGSLLLPSALVVIALDQEKKERLRLRIDKITDSLLTTAAAMGYRTARAEWSGCKGLDDTVVKGVQVRVSAAHRGSEATDQQLFPASIAKLSTVPTAALQAPNGYVCIENVVEYLKSVGPVLRSSFRTWDLELTRLIQSGRVKMKKTKDGQLLWVESE